MFKKLLGFLPYVTLRRNVITVVAEMEVKDCDALKSGKGLKNIIETYLSQELAKKIRELRPFISKKRSVKKMSSTFFSSKIRIIK